MYQVEVKIDLMFLSYKELNTNLKFSNLLRDRNYHAGRIFTYIDSDPKEFYDEVKIININFSHNNLFAVKKHFI